MTFLLDTGANRSVIAAARVDDVSVGAASEIVAAQGAGGELAERAPVVLGRFTVGDSEFDGLVVAVIDLSLLSDRLGRSVDGIIGLDVLGRGGFCLDLERGRLLLDVFNGFDNRPVIPRTWRRIPFELLTTGLIKVDVSTSAGSHLTGFLDFGAAKSIVSLSGLALFGPPQAVSNATGARQAMGADGAEMAAMEVKLGNFRIGEFRCSAMMAYGLDLPVFGRLDPTNGPVMLVGLDVFEGRVVAIDFTARSVYVSRRFRPRRLTKGEGDKN